MENRIPFDANETSFKQRMATGHEMNQGHTLTGYYIETSPGIYALVRTCGC
jgi:hypothetical protein